MIVVLTPAARPKAPQGKAASTDPALQDQQQQLDVQQAVFNIEMAEQAELQRERDAMEALMMQHIKNEDAIMKKWIEMA